MAQILIVEDEIFVATELESILLDLGHEIAGIAPDLPTAQALAEANPPDLALVDLNLRDGLTGPEVGRTLSERAVSVVFLTANPRLLGDGVAGTIGVLTKPTDDEIVAAAVDFALAKRAGATPTPTPPAALRVFN